MVYEKGKESSIIKYENLIFERYSRIIEKYTSWFRRYDCSLKVGLLWKNSLEKSYSSYRIPFSNGYSCYVSCEVLREGKEVQIRSYDGEADYYILSNAWLISTLERSIFSLKVLLYDGECDVNEDIQDWLRLLYDNRK